VKNKKRLLLLFGIILVITILWIFDVFQYLKVERMNELVQFIKGFGILAPIVFILLYIMATVFFLPGLPLTLLSGVVFGPILGSICVSIGSTTGATLAFLVGRYTGRAFVVERFSKSDLFRRLDKGVNKQGWKMVAITRLVPLFPFNAQNYAYGLTNVPLRIYVLVSFLCMLPATFAYTFLAGAIIGGEGNATKTITYIGIGIGLIIALSLASKVIIKKNALEESPLDKEK